MNDVDIMNDVGILSQVKNLEYEDLLLMIKMLQPYKENLTLMLSYFRSMEDMLRFLDLFAGINLKLPTRSRIKSVLFNIEVYNYYNAHLDDPNDLRRTAKRFNITTQRVKAIIDRVSARA